MTMLRGQLLTLDCVFKLTLRSGCWLGGLLASWPVGAGGWEELGGKNHCLGNFHRHSQDYYFKNEA